MDCYIQKQEKKARERLIDIKRASNRWIVTTRDSAKWKACLQAMFICKLLFVRQFYWLETTFSLSNQILLESHKLLSIQGNKTVFCNSKNIY